MVREVIPVIETKREDPVKLACAILQFLILFRFGVKVILEDLARCVPGGYVVVAFLISLQSEEAQILGHDI